MKHTAYVVSSSPAHPQDIIWMEPMAWDAQGKPTHFKKQKAFVSETKILGGYRYVVRACSLRVPPPQLPG